MDTLVQADLFFFITSIAIVVITIAVLMALFYFIQILRDVRYTTKRIREETDRIVSDVDNLKEIVGGVLHIFKGKPRARRSKKREA